jgi:hypothetical protein
MIDELIKSITNNIVPVKEGYYIVNCISGECYCKHFIWYGPLRNICKHCHAANIYKEFMKQNMHVDVIYNTKIELVQYFRNKERIIPNSQKNKCIYSGTIEEAFQEIVRLYNLHGKLFTFYL